MKSTILTISFGCLLAWLVPCGRASAHGAFHEELQHNDELLNVAPNDSGVWFQRGRLHYLHGDWREALRDLEQAERLAPGVHPVGLLRGQALLAGRQWDEARKVLDEFVQAHPEVSDGYATRARILLQLGKSAEAVADFETALAKLRQPEPDLYVETAEALVAGRQPERAVRVLESGMARLGAIPALALKALELESSLGKFDAALARVAALQKNAPRPEPWMARRAELLAKAGRREEARTAWSELRARLAGLPVPERSSHAMSVLAEQADQALAASE